MSIFDSIKSAIWGHGGVTTLPGTVPPGGQQPLPGTVPPSTGPAPAPVDVNAILTKLAANHPELDWHHSIVDLMKLLNLDSSFQNRTALAKELGYSGNMTDSAAMNTWLYKEVMGQLAASGGKIPPDLLK